MLKIKFLAALGILAAVFSINDTVSAQSSRNGDGKDYSLSGDSLTGINQRTANEDFPIFFTTETSSTTPVQNREQNATNTNSWRIGEQYKPILLRPSEQTVDGNDGFQVLFDLTNTNETKDLK